ncbi:MAG: electron transfer flavoprotein subunit beta/FixA family protein [Patescibacteria group bacterium]
MNIIVCVKQAPDIEKSVKIAEKIIDEGSDFVLNPLDEHAVKEAVNIKEKMGGKITALTLGPERAKQALLRCLARGADEAIHIKTDTTYNFDSTVVSVVLAEKIKTLPFDIILFGSKSVDTNSGSCGVQIAKILDIPCVPEIIKLEIGQEKAVVIRQMDGGEETVECLLPAVFTCQKGINELGLLRLPEILQAKKKPLIIENLSQNISSTSEIISLEFLPERKSGLIIKGSPEEQVNELVIILKKQGIPGG